MINVCDIQVMKPLLQEHGFRFSKAKGQNFLIASWVPESIAREAGVDETAGVLEIGPGIGPLTQQLCLRAGRVCAVELDTRLKPLLDITVGEFSNLEILWADALKLDLPGLVREKLGGLPHQSADWFAMTGYFEAKPFKHQFIAPSPVFLQYTTFPQKSARVAESPAP